MVSLCIYILFCLSSFWSKESSESQPSGPTGPILHRPRLQGSPLHLTGEMWRSEHPWCSTEEKETGDAAGMTRAFGVWTCAIPKGRISTCFLSCSAFLSIQNLAVIQRTQMVQWRLLRSEHSTESQLEFMFLDSW